MFKPNYNKYTISELEEALRVIDSKKYPKRIQQVESLLNDPVKRKLIKQRSIDKLEQEKQRKAEIKRRSEPFGWGIFFTISAFIVYFFGFIPSRFQVSDSTIESNELRILIAVIFLIFAAVFFYKKFRKEE